MPNDTLYLEVDEEIPSVIEKLKRQPTDEVVLVIPAGSSLVASVVNVKLLKRAAERAKKRLALVTTDPVGRHIAATVGVPVFVSVKDRRSIEPPRPAKPDPVDQDVDLRPVVVDAPAGVSVHHYGESVSENGLPAKPAPPSGFSARPVTQPEPTVDEETLPEPTSTEEPAVPALRLNIRPSTNATPPSPRRRPGLVLISLLVIVGGLAALWYFYPRVAVALTVATEPYEAKANVTVDSSKQFVTDATGGTIAGDRLDATADASKDHPATGTKDAGTKASGTVALQNRLGQAVKLSSSTTLTEAGVSFQTTSDITIPAATASIDANGGITVVPGSATVGAQAASAGDAGNIAGGTALSVTGVSDSVASKVSASASGAFSGGTTKQVKVISQADIDAVKLAAQADATAAAKQKLTAALAGKKLIDAASRITTVSDELSGKLGDEADTVTDKATVKYEAIVFDDAAASAAVTKLMDQSVPSGKMLVRAPSDSMTVNVNNLDWTAGSFVLSEDVKTTLAAAVDRAAILKVLAGKSLAAAEAALATQPGIQHATFTFRPGWLRRLPLRTSAIDVQFTQPPATK